MNKAEKHDEALAASTPWARQIALARKRIRPFKETVWLCFSTPEREGNYERLAYGKTMSKGPDSNGLKR